MGGDERADGRILDIDKSDSAGSHGGDRGRIHSHLERCAAAVILPAVFPGTVRSAAAGFPLVRVVLHKKHAELVVA